MKIEVDRLKEDIVENFQEIIDPAALDLNNQELGFCDNVTISTTVKKELGVVRARSHFVTNVKYTCSRCLKSCVFPLEKDYDFDYPIERPGQIIDTVGNLREEIILDFPPKFLCRPDCSGLCLKCGKDLNEGVCGCDRD